ncbi:MAG TPA: GYF domain-containing protein [Candidatus Sulfopaludibacter sp.]|nr:GYF domain-containing protein [Candidatus Sulfopaludibacter sp.]
MYKIIGADGQPYGPVNAEQLRRWLAENRVNAQTLVQTEGAPDWKPLCAIPEFASELKPVPPPIAPLPTLAARASNKIPAGICGILLGALGIHKFILGYTGAGLVMLLVSLLSCLTLWPVMHLIGLIEGIIYLCKPDDEFVRVYVDGRKEWF